MNAKDPAASARAASREPTSVLIAALGGQGGGVLAGWIVHAARSQRLLAQATSTPGVSQRTGATIYYVEIAPAPPAGQPLPVLGLAPIPGRVDVLVCAELLEAARMLERGMATPSRTVVVASTHRVYTTREKMSSDDGRFGAARIVEATRALSRRAVLFDMDAVRTRHRAAISAALFGALAGSGALPLPRANCEDAIRTAGIGIEPSLAAFADAFARAAQGGEDAVAGTVTATPGIARPTIARMLAARVDALPAHVAEVAFEGVAQLAAYQDEAYAAHYLDRVERIVQAAASGGAAAGQAARETARCLALWMAYDDLIRVASAKSRGARFERIRGEAGARDGDVVRVYDHFRPGALEIAAILPRPLGAWLERRALARRAAGPAGRSVTLQTSSITGALMMRVLAALRRFRPSSLRFAREQQAIDAWLAFVERALRVGGRGRVDDALALATLPRLLKGYGETHAGGEAEFRRRLADYYQAGGPDAVDALAALQPAGATDPACGSRATPGTAAMPMRAQPVVWLDQR